MGSRCRCFVLLAEWILALAVGLQRWRRKGRIGEWQGLSRRSGLKGGQTRVRGRARVGWGAKLGQVRCSRGYCLGGRWRSPVRDRG